MNNKNSLKPLLDKKEALRYLGYQNQDVDENTKILLDQSAEEIIQTARPKYIWQVFKIDQNMNLYPSIYPPHMGGGPSKEESRTKDYQVAYLKDEDFYQDSVIHLKGEDIKNNLQTAGHCVLFAASLGIEVDKLLAKAQHISMARAVILDACASSYIESICDLCSSEIAEHFSQEKLITRPRFSPGYGDLPLDLQGQFCQALDTQRKIGLTCSDNNLLLPRKSVTAIVGLVGEKVPKASPHKKDEPCTICSLKKHCQKRKDGQICGKNK